MSEHPDHIPTHTGSGTAKCSCGWTSKHFSHDDDLWESFDAHVTARHGQINRPLMVEIHLLPGVTSAQASKILEQMLTEYDPDDEVFAYYDIVPDPLVEP